MKKTIGKKDDFDDFVNRDFQSPQAGMDESIADLPISTRVWHVLQKLGVQRMGDLVKLTERDLKQAEGLGQKSLREIKNLIGEMNLALTKNEAQLRRRPPE